jgi:REP element-mobilizing transposase RayT
VHPVLWFDELMRDVLGLAVARVIDGQSYTCWACGVLKNHLHVCIHRHRDDAKTMLERLEAATREALIALPNVRADHPIWAERPYKRFLYTPDDVRRIIDYIERNPINEGLGRQVWPFVLPYDGWPFHKYRPR